MRTTPKGVDFDRDKGYNGSMNIYVPEYYASFRCIASRCGHTCCAGWEIDIDGESLARYDRLPGEFGERVRRCVSREGTPHFILGKGER